MKKIMVVEDESVLQKALSIELMGSGFEVMSASDGETGLAAIRKEIPDLVLLDIRMPKMNGFEVLAELKKDAATKKIPVVILSNQASDEEKKKGLALGAVDYYVKSSTDLSELSEKVKKLIQ